MYVNIACMWSIVQLPRGAIQLGLTCGCSSIVCAPHDCGEWEVNFLVSHSSAISSNLLVNFSSHFLNSERNKWLQYWDSFVSGRDGKFSPPIGLSTAIIVPKEWKTHGDQSVAWRPIPLLWWHNCFLPLTLTFSVVWCFFQWNTCFHTWIPWSHLSCQEAVQPLLTCSTAHWLQCQSSQ